MSWFKFGKNADEAPSAKGVSKPGIKPAASPTVQKPFHAIEIKGGPNCCQAVKSVEKQRFLSRGMPRPPQVPVPECDRPMDCSCRYIHYDDRRTEARRNVWAAGFATDLGNTHFANVRGTDKIREGRRGRRKDD